MATGVFDDEWAMARAGSVSDGESVFTVKLRFGEAYICRVVVAKSIGQAREMAIDAAVTAMKSDTEEDEGIWDPLWLLNRFIGGMYGEERDRISLDRLGSAMDGKVINYQNVLAAIKGALTETTECR